MIDDIRNDEVLIKVGVTRDRSGENVRSQIYKACGRDVNRARV